MKPESYQYARFLYFALENCGPKPREEGMQEDFEELVRVWDSDEEFRREMESFFYVLNMEIVDVSLTNGIVVLPIDQECIFSTSIESYRKANLGNSHIASIVLLAVVCCFYKEFENNKGENVVVSVTVDRVQKFLANAMKQFQDNPDQESVPLEMQQMWVELDKLPQSQPSSGRASLATVQGAITLTLGYLVQNKLLREGTREAEGEYIAAPRFRFHVRELLNERLYKTFYNLLGK